MRITRHDLQRWALILGIGVPLTFAWVYLLARCAHGPLPLG
jgi:hypothetical protein